MRDASVIESALGAYGVHDQRAIFPGKSGISADFFDFCDKIHNGNIISTLNAVEDIVATTGFICSVKQFKAVISSETVQDRIPVSVPENIACCRIGADNRDIVSWTNDW